MSSAHNKLEDIGDYKSQEKLTSFFEEMGSYSPDLQVLFSNIFEQAGDLSTNELKELIDLITTTDWSNESVEDIANKFAELGSLGGSADAALAGVIARIQELLALLGINIGGSGGKAPAITTQEGAQDHFNKIQDIKNKVNGYGDVVDSADVDALEEAGVDTGKYFAKNAGGET
jgi:hypothetical protein